MVVKASFNVDLAISLLDSRDETFIKEFDKGCPSTSCSSGTISNVCFNSYAFACETKQLKASIKNEKEKTWETFVNLTYLKAYKTT